MATTVLSVRVNEAERGLLEIAAKQAHTNLSDFVRRKAIESAEMEILDKRVVDIPADDWAKFEAWLYEPAKVLPQVQELMKSKPVWE